MRCYYDGVVKLNDYLKSPGAMSIAELRRAVGVGQDAQIRQWQHGYSGRLPSPANCAAIERATKGAVMRWDLRPDWADIWPELRARKARTDKAVA